MSEQSPYFKLHPEPATPLDEICHCGIATPIKLMGGIGPNPIHCVDCNLEVVPETLNLDLALIESIARWRSVHNSLFDLWLDSGQYEDWAKSQLLDMHGQVNVAGLEVAANLNKIRRCYYWIFQDESEDDYQPPEKCPNCGGPFQTYNAGIFPQLMCDRCSILCVGVR